jgi:hypothetical protein
MVRAWTAAMVAASSSAPLDPCASDSSSSAHVACQDGSHRRPAQIGPVQLARVGQ